MAYQNNPPHTAVLNALANPARQQIFEALAKQPLSVVAIAKTLPISRPAVSQHLKVLLEAGMVCCKVEGARHIYVLRPQGLADLHSYLEQFRKDDLIRFAAEVDAENNAKMAEARREERKLQARSSRAGPAKPRLRVL